MSAPYVSIKRLADNSLSAMLSAVEVYNKPQMTYRGGVTHLGARRRARGQSYLVLHAGRILLVFGPHPRLASRDAEGASLSPQLAAPCA